MWNKLFGCVSETLEISSQTGEEKSIKNSLNNLTTGSYLNLNNQDDILKQQVSVVEKLANPTDYLNSLNKLSNSSPDKNLKEKFKKSAKLSTSKLSTSIVMNHMIGSTAKKKIVLDEVTTQAATQFSRKRNEENAKTSGFIVASSIYGQFLVVICLVLFTAEIRTSLPLNYFEGFFFYLYSVSILFLLYVFFYLLRGMPTSELRSKERKFKKDKVFENEKSHGSIFLRIGCITFGLGVMVFNGIELGSYFEFGKSSPCHSIYLFLNPLLQSIFSFLQMYFIFTYSRLMINKFKLIARVGLIHLVATNVCTWIKILLKETLQTLHLTESASSHATLEELILPLKIELKQQISNSNVLTATSRLNVSNPCMKDNIMGTILADASTYLYPFIVEYSLIGAAFLYVMWTSIGRLTNTYANGNYKSSLALTNHHHSNKKRNCPHLSNQINNQQDNIHEPTVMNHRQSRSGSVSPSLSVNHLNNMDNNGVVFNTSANQMETNLNNHNLLETNSSSCSPTNQTTNTSITPTSTGNPNLISNVQSTPPTNRNVLLINTHQLSNSNYIQSANIANNVAGNNSNVLLLDNISMGSSRDSFNGKYSGHLSYQVNSMYNNNLLQSSQSLYSCLGSSRGLFCGFLFLVISIITLIVFFVLYHHANYHYMASLINEGSHSVLLILSSLSIIAAYFKVRKLKFQPGVNETADSGLREILLKVAAFGLYTYSLFGAIAGALNINDLQNFAVLVTSTLNMIQVSLQSLFISDIVCRKRNSRQQVPQQIITFLMIVNLIFWVLYTFGFQKVDTSPVQVKVYGQLTWALIVRITLPLSIFYRFHSAITFAEVHKSILNN